MMMMIIIMNHNSQEPEGKMGSKMTMDSFHGAWMKD
jgi:hypothetical protein